MTQVQCPNCHSRMDVTPRLSGRKVKCKCETILRMPKLQEDAPIIAEMADDFAELPPIKFQCPKCSQTLQVEAEMAGKVTRCPCGIKMCIPAAVSGSASTPQPRPASNFGHDPFAAQPTPGNATFANPHAASSPFGAGDPFANPGFEPVDPFTGDGLMSAASVGIDPLTGQPAGIPNVATRPRPKNIKPKKILKKRKPEKESGFEGEIIMGILAMLGAVVWFVGGLACGVFFFYPPVLFFLGLAGVVKGLMD